MHSGFEGAPALWGALTRLQDSASCGASKRLGAKRRVVAAVVVEAAAAVAEQGLVIQAIGAAAAVEGGRLEVRPIGSTQGLKELAALHRKTWGQLNVQEKQVHMLLWPAALHFGLYWMRPGESRRRPPLIGAFWARCLSDAPLTLGHLYPPVLFRGLTAEEVFEFGGMVIDPTLQHRGLVRTLSDTARLFLFSRRPTLIITNPVEPLYRFYKSMGLKTVGDRPVEHPHAFNVKVWLMYGRWDQLARPFFM